MPRDSNCIDKHRRLKHIACGECSNPFWFSIKAVDEIYFIENSVKATVFFGDKWAKYQEELDKKISLAIIEGALNAVEHGVLGFGKNTKEKLLTEKGIDYLDHVNSLLSKAQKEAFVTLCFNDARILLGFHDSGEGFNPLKFINKQLSIEDLTAANGRGLIILKGAGFGLQWNKDGNSLYCTIQNPDAANSVSAYRSECKSNISANGDVIPFRQN